MTQKFVIGLAATLMAVFSVSAQYSPTNARIRSIGDIYTVDDIGNVYRYAAHMSKYTDDIQITFPNPILGIKSFGDMLSVGTYIRQGLVLDQQSTSNFYSVGRGFLNVPLDPDLSNPTFIPHALLGFNVGAFTLGFDLFMEWANARFDSETTVGGVTTTVKRNTTLRNPGFIGSILLDINDLPISLKAGLAFPGISGLSETDATPPTKNEYKSDKGLYIEFGGDIGLPIQSARLTLGADYIHETYAFNVNSSDPVSSFSTNRLAIFGGIQNEAFDNGLWAVLYQLKLLSHKQDFDASATADLSNSTFEHIVTAGAENGWDNVWIFDKAFLRGGVGLHITTLYGKAESETTKAKAKNQKTFSAEPTVGFGLNKGQFELDMQVGLTPGAGGWEKLATGPGVSTVTGTLRF